ncbi:hypothetical protein TSAR_013454, partial [Trichomalopsis sarcophagae]
TEIEITGDINHPGCRAVDQQQETHLFRDTSLPDFGLFRCCCIDTRNLSPPSCLSNNRRKTRSKLAASFSISTKPKLVATVSCQDSALYARSKTYVACNV